MRKFLLLISCLCFFSTVGQNLSLYDQFNGNYDYTAIGATLNPNENNLTTTCTISTTASATLTLNPNQTVEAAYLYWAGSGTGDFSVTLNSQNLTPDRTFSYILPSSIQISPGNYTLVDHDYFSAFKDITNIVSSTGNGQYTLSNLDLFSAINDPNLYYCDVRTNFGGWAIIVIYEDSSLPLNQINVYDGLQGVSGTNSLLQINLSNLNVIDNQGAKIGFLAWEGDASLAVNETLRVNGNILSNPPLNPANNAFNSTNSFTGDNDLYNMDLDFYDIENNINIGDSSATIELTSGQDVILVNNVITVLNSQLPEPSPEIDDVLVNCNSREITLDYTIYNTNATDFLPANTLISFFADGLLLAQTATQNDIAIGDSESNQITLQISGNIPNNFNLSMSVNIDANGDPIITEINPDNNFNDFSVQLLDLEIDSPLQDIEVCDDISNVGVSEFDLTINEDLAIGDQTDVSVSFYKSQNDAENNLSPITNPENYENSTVPEIIWLKLTSTIDPDCYLLDSFTLDIFFTPVAQNSPNLEICTENPEELLANFNLTENSNIIINNQPNSNIQFFNTLNDATLNQNSILSPATYQNTTSPETIFVRLENEKHPECYTLTNFQINVNPADISEIEGLLNCDEGFNAAYFDFTEIEENLNLASSEEIINYYISLEEAFSNENSIQNTFNFKNETNPQTIYVRIDDLTTEECYRVVSFPLSVENCPPFIPQGFSPNGDGINDTFEISGLYDIFENFNLKIYSRYGNLIYEANNNIPAWDGTSNKGISNKGNQLPTGTYYYILNLNDPNYKVYKSWVYLQR